MSFARHIKRRDGFPLCGRSDFDPTEFVENESETDCWECASIEGIDPEQLERNLRRDLCEECRPMEHPTCGMDFTCACCKETVRVMEESGMTE